MIGTTITISMEQLFHPSVARDFTCPNLYITRDDETVQMTVTAHCSAGSNLI
jgi:hypothetical protein